MPYVTNDFECLDCGREFECMYYRPHGQLDSSGDAECPDCGSQSLKRLVSAPNIAAFSIASPEQKADILKRRSAKHTAKEVAKEPERWGAAGIQRQQAAKNPMVGASGKKRKK